MCREIKERPTNGGPKTDRSLLIVQQKEGLNWIQVSKVESNKSNNNLEGEY